MKSKSIVQKLRIPVSILVGAAFFLSAFYSDSIWDEKKLPIEGVLFFVGITLVGLASLGRLWCMMYIAGNKTKTLVTEGPYSLTRNPLYFFSMLGFIGVGLCTETLSMPLLLLSAFSCYYPWVIRKEEVKLRAVHGVKFDEYARSTPKFFPKFAFPKEPERLTINPRFFMRHIGDTMLFPICVGALELIEQLHKIHDIPHYFHLY